MELGVISGGNFQTESTQYHLYGTANSLRYMSTLLPRQCIQRAILFSIFHPIMHDFHQQATCILRSQFPELRYNYTSIPLCDQQFTCNRTLMRQLTNHIYRSALSLSNKRGG